MGSPPSCVASLDDSNSTRARSFSPWQWMDRINRGQLTTMLRQLGTVPVPTDFLVFHDELDSGTAPRPRS